jgi:uncharacterized membrane protein HdeD (DUF308 family)
LVRQASFLIARRRDQEYTMNKREERLRFLAEGAQNRVSSRLGDIWWAFMLRGVFAGVLGICALIWPTLSFTILTRLVGLYLVADGLPGLLGALRASASGTYMLQAIVSLVAGGVLLFLPSASARTLLMVFGGWALSIGVSHILAARRANVEDTDRGPMTTMGAMVTVVGLVLLIWPGTGVVAISWIIALAALLFAALLIFVALRLKRLKKRVDELKPLRSTE